MGKLTKVFCAGFLSFIFFYVNVYAEEINNKELMQELKTVKDRIEKLESSLMQKNAEIEDLEKKTAGINREMSTEEAVAEICWSDRINISGAVEVEISYESMEFSDPGEPDTDTSDIALATVELGVDAEITDHVSGHVLLLWEEDDTEPVDIDEGFVSISGEDIVPLYLDAGKMYVPFGAFESHFISDPITLEIGETRESAVRVGFANNMFDISLSLFNGDIDGIGDDEKIKAFAGRAAFSLPEGTVPDLDLSIGISYISNIADSDGLEGEVAVPLADYVGGLGFFLSASLMQNFFFEVEYIRATDKFEPGELGFDNGIACKPGAYNLEFAWVPCDDLEFGVKYEGSDDLGALLPEKQFGIVAYYSLFENTSIGLEYMNGEYENSDERDLVTFQIAVEF